MTCEHKGIAAVLLLAVLGGIAAAFDVNVWAWACDVIGGMR